MRCLNWLKICLVHLNQLSHFELNRLFTNKHTCRACFLLFITCDRGWYGIGCQNTCGHCIKGTHCIASDGICMFGCDDGYQGYLCKLGDFIYLVTVSFSYPINLLSFVILSSVNHSVKIFVLI